MNKKELKKLLKSEEFENIVKKFNNKAEKLQNEIYTSYVEGTVDREVKFSKKDRFYTAIQVYTEIASELPDTVWGQQFAEDLFKQIDWIKKVITNNLVDEIGIPYTTPTFTENDIKTVILTECLHNTTPRLESLIDSLDKPKEKDDNIYE